MKNRLLGVLFNSIIHPSHLVVIFRDILRVKHKVHDNKTHLEAAIDWLCRTQDKSGCGGCAEAYTFDNGWTPPYPETTGYIIQTFLRYSKLVNDNDYVERAIKMADWEIDIQFPDGSVRGGVGVNDYPIVFNTGQVILGWADLYGHTGEERFLNAAKKAADWLVEIMDDDGKWVKSTYNKIPHAYNSRVTWSMLEVFKHTNDKKYKEAAVKNVEWVLSQAKENAWFEKMGFRHEDIPLTHTIAYTLRGLLECSFLLEGEIVERIQKTVILAAENIMRRYELRKKDPYSMPKFLPGRLNEKWNSTHTFSCLTGNAQMALIWLKIYELNKDARFLNASLKIIDQVKSTQSLRSINKGIRGAIAGSYPIWGEYVRFSYPNWATKFFADAIMLQERIMKEIEE